MPLSSTFRRRITHPRKIASVSVATALIVSVLFITLTLSLVWQRRNEQHDRLASAAQSYILNVFNKLSHTLFPLHALTRFDCASVNADLTQRAAFAGNIRAILLVENHSAFCSSATGSRRFDIAWLSPDTDTGKTTDIRLVPETPMVPGQPAIVFWQQNPSSISERGILATLNINLTPYLLLAARQKEITGMAIVAGRQALTVTDGRVADISSLPAHPLRTLSVPGYPVRVLLFGTVLADSDVLVIMLAGVLMALFSGSACFLLLSLRLRPGKEILQGISRGEFYVEYQPVIEAVTGNVYGLEALLRWTHPTAGSIPPDLFISYAEGQNQIVPLTRHLFELVARDAHKLRHTLPEGLCMALNLSPRHLAERDFCQDVRRWLAAMPPNHFQYMFEITERSMVGEHNAVTLFDWLQAQHIRIAIDDFGTGHSALIYLEKFSFDCLKIDRGFVQSIGRETVTSPVLDAVIALAKKLGLKTVAEGVESEAQARWLTERGVTHVQGYLFSRPLTVPQLIDYFRQATPASLTERSQRRECLES